MRIADIYCVMLAWTAAALAEEPRPRRHLHQIKDMIVDKLFSRDCNCTKDPPIETKFYEIPGFKDVVIKAVPKGSNTEPAPVNEKLPPNSHIGIVRAYLGTNTLNETYNALLGVKNLLTSGILSGKPEVLQEVGLVPSRVQVMAKPVKPCRAPGFSPLYLDPVRVLVKPPAVPVVPTQYSYKQVNQDGSLTTYTSSLDLKNGVRVIEDGKAVPFFIDRVRKIPVRLPVPVLPDVSNIIVPEVVQPATYSYQQMWNDGGIASYMRLPSMINQPGPVVVTETGARIPPPPVFLMDRIEKAAAIATYPKAPFMAVPSMPVAIHAEAIGVGSVPVPGPSGYSYSQMNVNGGMTHSVFGANKSSVIVTEKGYPKDPLNVPSFPEKNPLNVHAPMPVAFNAATIEGGSVPVPGLSGYSYSQMNINGGMTTHSASGNKASVLVTENGMAPSLPEKNPFKVPAGVGTYSYIQGHGDGKSMFDGLGVPGPVNVVEHKHLAVSSGIPFPPNSFTYKQIGDGKITTYRKEGTFEENLGARPAFTLHGMPHPIPPPHITDRIEKVAAGANYNRPPYLPMPVAVPVPTGFVSVPSVYSSPPQRPVKIPITPRMNSFLYKHVHNDGFVTSYSSRGSNEEGKTQSPPPADMKMPFPQGNVRVFDSQMYSGPFPMNPVNPNAIKPSTPVSGSYSYKLLNKNFQGSHPPVGPVYGPMVDTFAPPEPISMPAPIQGCIDPEISDPVVHMEDPLVPAVPLTYSYKQISHSNPDPFLVVNVEDPVRGVNNGNVDFNENNQAYPYLPSLTPPANPFTTVNVMDPKPGFEQPPFVSAPIMKMPINQQPKERSPSSSFTYKQVTNQGYQQQPQFSDNIADKPQKINMPMAQAQKESSPPSSFSYKQITNQAFQPLSSPESTTRDMEHLPNKPSLPPPMINTRGPETQIKTEDNAPSSFSYKQVTNEGVYEYSDEFPTSIKTNLPPNAMNRHENPPIHGFEQKPLPTPTIPTPTSVSRMPAPSRPKPSTDRQDSLANNPIIVPDTSSASTFSFKSANPDGSTITVKDDGHDSITVHVDESPKTEASQAPTIESTRADGASRAEPVLKASGTTLAPEGTTAVVSGHARPMRRRVIKRVKPVKHRGDIPDDE